MQRPVGKCRDRCRDRSLRIYTHTHINMNVADKGYQSLKLSVLDTIQFGIISIHLVLYSRDNSRVDRDCLV